MKLNKPLTQVDGTVIPDMTIGQSLAQVIASSSMTGPDALKFWELARKLAKDEDIVLDTVDKEKLIAFIEKEERMTVLLKGQLLLALKEPDAQS
jgi:hypothetical protein